MVVDLEVVDKQETGGKSATMEKLAFSRLLQRLKDVLKIYQLVTDASTSIKALVQDLKGIAFYFLNIINARMAFALHAIFAYSILVT